MAFKTQVTMTEEAQDAAAAVDSVAELRLSAPSAPAPPSLSEPYRPSKLERYAPDAMLQTGPGIPNWSYLTYRLRWSGPVDEQQTVRLTIVPPLLLSLWRIFGVLAAAALLLSLVRLAYGVPRAGACRRGDPQRQRRCSLRCRLCFAPRAQAQAPDASLLGELKKRLSEPAKCVPDCVEAVMATVIVDGDRLEVQMDVHAQASVVLGIPQAGQQWIIERVAVDDRAFRCRRARRRAVAIAGCSLACIA